MDNLCDEVISRLCLEYPTCSYFGLFTGRMPARELTLIGTAVLVAVDIDIFHSRKLEFFNWRRVTVNARRIGKTFKELSHFFLSFFLSLFIFSFSP